MKKRNKIILTFSVIILCLCLFVVYLLWKDFRSKISISTSLKTDLMYIQSFQQKKGRYPEDLHEVNLFGKFQYDPEKGLLVYQKPKEKDKDETIIWCKKRSYLGYKVGMKESGISVFEK